MGRQPGPQAWGRGFVRFLLHWHGIPRRRHGPDGLRRTVSQLQGIPIPVSELERSVLRVRVSDYSPLQLDELIASRSVVWQGERPLGRHDGEISLYRARDFPSLGRISVFAPGERERLLRDTLAAERSVDFGQLAARLGGFPDDLLRSLWRLAWNGEVTSDSLEALRSRQSSPASRFHRRNQPRYTTRRRILPGSAGSWSLLAGPSSGFAPESRRSLAAASQLLDQVGIACRRTLAGETAGFDRLLLSLLELEELGQAQRVRLLDTGDEPQLAAPGAEAAWQAAQDECVSGVLAACDPACPYGAALAWPPMETGYVPSRSPGAQVLVHDGRLVGYLAGKGRGMYTPRDDVNRDVVIRLLKQPATEHPVYIESINGEPPYETPWHRGLIEAGFSPSRRGYLLRARD